MTKLKKLVVSGFRGILMPLELNLASNGVPQSLILYGGNGTGKSSLTDAWEWLTTGKIAHLAREGAEESAYPHMVAKAGTVSVQAEFSDTNVATVGLAYNHKRITMPTASGKLAEARKLLTHPCHIRHGDLTRFVFLRKSERYDALATLMGFVPQMEYLKALRRVETLLGENLKKLNTIREQSEAKFKMTYRVTELNFAQAWQQMTVIYAVHGIEAEADESGIHAGAAKLKAAVTNDPNAKTLADIRVVEAAVKGTKTPATVPTKIAVLREAVGQLKAEQLEQHHILRLLPLFRAAKDLFEKVPPSGFCPLCRNEFNGDLKEHVESECARMQHLQAILTKLNSAKTDVKTALSSHKNISDGIDEATETINATYTSDILGVFKSTMKPVDEAIANVQNLLAFDSSDLPGDIVEKLTKAENELEIVMANFDTAKTRSLTNIQTRKVNLEEDPKRTKLVSDYQSIASGLELIESIRNQKTFVESASKVFSDFSLTVEHYVAASLLDVQKRFDEISERVKVYFEALEKNTIGLGAPKMRLLTDQDRSVVLEVFFHGEPIHPAHKYLSESQLNSFGLAVFLASATHFNKNCSILLLDDVVNSFDAYKRPHLIELLIDHLGSHQVILLTHDRFWRDLLHRRLPTWTRINFTGYSFGIGPKFAPALNALERIRSFLDEDEPDQASAGFAQYLEDVLQDLCESFEVECKFNRRNEYTLDTLIDRLRVRVREKLKQVHPLTTALQQMLEDNAYRNWSIHCKNPESPIQTSEIKGVLKNWEVIETLCRCSECSSLLKYDGKNGFKCKCGKQTL